MPDQISAWCEQMRQYVHLLYAWSGRTNLVSSRDRLRLAARHLLPSMAMRRLLLGFPHRIVADLGSGSGLPGVPLKISLPDIEFQLIESRRRRANFLREVVRKLGLRKVEVVNERIEDWPCPDERRPDVIVSRASMSPQQLCGCSMGILRPEGRILFSMKSDESEDQASLDNVRVADTGFADSEGRPIRIGVLAPTHCKQPRARGYPH